jgi:hypothetical protein
MMASTSWIGHARPKKPIGQGMDLGYCSPSSAGSPSPAPSAARRGAAPRGPPRRRLLHALQSLLLRRLDPVLRGREHKVRTRASAIRFSVAKYRHIRCHSLYTFIHVYPITTLVSTLALSGLGSHLWSCLRPFVTCSSSSASKNPLDSATSWAMVSSSRSISLNLRCSVSDNRRPDTNGQMVTIRY